jgi:hypothetical protein
MAQAEVQRVFRETLARERVLPVVAEGVYSRIITDFGSV